MAKQSINVGATANDKKGDSLRAAFQKVNANFTELYTALGLNADTTLNLGAFEFTGSTISTTDSSSIIIDQATTVTSNLTVGGDILPQTAFGGDLGSAAKPWRSLYVSGSTIYLGNAALSVDANGELSINNNRLIQDNGNYISLNSNVNDVNVSDPQPGDTLQWGPGYWINVPNSDHKLVAGDLENGIYTVELGADGSLEIPGDIRSEGNINIDINLADSTLRRWRFGEDGNTEFPGMITASDIQANTLFVTDVTGPVDEILYLSSRSEGLSVFNLAISTTLITAQTDLSISNNSTLSFSAGSGIDFTNATITGSVNTARNIESESDVSIRVNLTDSTIRIWQFGEDGDLRIPGDITSRQPTDLNLRSGYSVSIVTDWGDNDRTWLFDGTSGELVLPGGNVLIDPTDDNFEVRGAENVNFEANAVINVYTDDGNHQWQFGDDGVLKLAADSGSLYANNATGRVSIGDYLGPNGAPAAPSKIFHIGGPDYVAQISGYAVSNPPVWTFGNDRSLEIPGDIRSETGFNIDINLSDSTLRRWTFGEDGELTFPDSSAQSTAYPGTLAAAKLPYYADTAARNAAITSPANGMAVIVGGSLYIYGNAQWLQITGTP